MFFEHMIALIQFIAAGRVHMGHSRLLRDAIHLQSTILDAAEIKEQLVSQTRRGPRSVLQLGHPATPALA
jgi:hypothetical protein